MSVGKDNRWESWKGSTPIERLCRGLSPFTGGLTGLQFALASPRGSGGGVGRPLPRPVAAVTDLMPQTSGSRLRCVDHACGRPRESANIYARSHQPDASPSLHIEDGRDLQPEAAPQHSPAAWANPAVMANATRSTKKRVRRRMAGRWAGVGVLSFYVVEQ